MSFVEKNKNALLCVLLVILSECIIPLLPYDWGEINDFVYTYGELLYHLITQGAFLFLCIVIYKGLTNLDSKGIFLGVILWYIFELFQQVVFILGFKIQWMNRVVWSKSDVMQIIFIIFTVILTYLAHKCYTSSLLSRLTLYMSTHIGGILKKAYRILRKR